MSQIGRQPCPYRILDDVGGAFGMGAIGGSVYYFFKGFRNTPSGGKIIGALNNARKRAPTLGSNFASWGFLYSSFDCVLSAVRNKEDIYNSIASGGLTGGVLAMRAGTKAILTNMVVGAAVIGMIEGFMIALDRYAQKRYSEMVQRMSPGYVRLWEPPPITLRLEDSFAAPIKAR